MFKGWNRMSEIGVHKHTPQELLRSIVLSNRIALVLAGLTSLLIAVLWSLTSLSPSLLRIMGSLLFYLSVPILNYYGKYNTSRSLLAVIVPIYIIFLIAVNPATLETAIYTASYFPPRILIIATSIIPFLLFNTYSEKIPLFTTTTVSLVCAVAYDGVLALLGKQVDVYAQFNVFIYYNVIFFIQFATLSISSFLLKRSVDRTDRENQVLLEQTKSVNDLLLVKNSSLQKLNEEKEAQHEEMLIQAEELNSSYEKMEESSRIIESQKNELAQHNTELEKLVASKSRDLLKTNEELVKHNSELRQFSFTVSHNLRAPVARLLGLTYLLEGFEQNLPDDLRNYISLIQKSTHELDSVIKDLNKIIDIRNEIYRIKERVYLQEEWGKIISILQTNIEPTMRLETSFANATDLFTIRPVIHNAFYNLLSNAIKYRSPKRNLHVMVSTAIQEDHILIRFTDNGLGIDLDKYRASIFHMYKRFHPHIEGKGIGLYLVKSQVESLGGTLEIDSEVNKGTTFLLSLPIYKSLQDQLFFENSDIKISYHAVYNYCHLSWQRPVQGEPFKVVYVKCLEMMSIYHTPLWLVDSRKLSTVAKSDLDWLFSSIFSQAVNNGLQRIALIVKQDTTTEDYLNYILKNAADQSIRLQIFYSLQKGKNWLTTSS